MGFLRENPGKIWDFYGISGGWDGEPWENVGENVGFLWENLGNIGEMWSASGEVVGTSGENLGKVWDSYVFWSRKCGIYRGKSRENWGLSMKHGRGMRLRTHDPLFVLWMDIIWSTNGKWGCKLRRMGIYYHLLVCSNHLRIHAGNSWDILAVGEMMWG